MSLMKKNSILEYLRELNSGLADIGKHGEMFMIGGAVLTLVYNVRDATRDVDCRFKPRKEILDIAATIAKKHNLNNDWISDDIEPFITPQMTFSEFMRFSNLIVHSIDDEPMLALKLSSARPAPSRDLSDSVYFMKRLKIESVDEAMDIVEKYVRPELIVPLVRHFAVEVFEKYQLETR